MRNKGLPKAGQRVKVGRRLVTLPGVRSLADPDLVAPATKADAAKPERPAEELSEELTRMIKSAYQ